MSAYQHTQPGTLMRISFAIAVLGFLVGAALAAGSDPKMMAVLAVLALVMFLAMLLFHSLTVEVARGYLFIRFGVGLVRKRWPLKDIESVEIVRNRWWYGWGIRLTPHGWLFNVSGNDAVQVRFESGKQVRIGTDEPRKLHRAIESALQRFRSPLNAGGR
jgi:hypothetical protein